jgi:replication factor A1
MSEMKTEVYINKIIENTGLTRKEIQDMVGDKKNELKGLISEEGALFIIARELGVDVKEENKELIKDIEINISDITPTMKNINLVGRIKEIHRVNKFNKNDGGVGYVGSFLLHDKTGDVRIVLWDDQVSIFNDNNFEINELVKIVNGIARKGRYNELEIHVGRYSKLKLSPDDVDYKNYPKIKFKLTNINEINLNLHSISIEGKIIQISPIKEFTKKDGELGKVGSLTLLDSTGSTRLTFWNDDIEKIKNLEINDVITISNLTPRLNTYDSKSIDLYATRSSVVKKISKNIQIYGELVQNIGILQDRKGIVSFKGKVTSIDNFKTIESKSGERIPLLGFVVSDDTDAIRITLWRERAEEFLEKLSIGQGLLLNNVMVRFSNFSQRNEISLINESTLELKEFEIENLKMLDITKTNSQANFSGNYKKIDSINASMNIELKGFIARDLNNITIYEACTKCFKKVDNCVCNTVNETEFRMIVNLIIDDGSGSIRATFIGDIAEKLMMVKTEKLVQIKETPDFDKFMEKKSSELLGKDIIIKGKAKFSDYSNSYELMAYEFKYLNVDEELEREIRKIET